MNVLPLLTTSFVVRRPLFVCGCYINNVNVNNVVRCWCAVAVVMYVCRFLTNTVRRDVVCASSINTVNGDGNGNDEDEGVDFLLSEAVVVPVSDRFLSWWVLTLN